MPTMCRSPGIPVGRTEAGECRDEDHATGVIDGFGQRTGLCGVVDDLEAVAQPLDRGTGDEDGALVGVGGLPVAVVEGPGDGGE